MKIEHRFLTPALLALALYSLNAEGPAQQPTIVDKRDPNDENNKLFIGSADGRDEEFLCNYTRSSGVVFSKDARWLTVNEHTASSGGDEIRIFKWVKGLKFSELVYNPTLSEVLYADAQRALGFTEYPENFGLNCVGWTVDENPKCLIEVRVTKEGKDYVLTRALVIDTGIIETVGGQ